MDEQTKTLVRESWAKVVPISDQAAELFYGKLFELNPTLRLLFKAPIAVQGKLLMKALDGAVASLDDLDALVPVLQDLGKRHTPYGVIEADYDTVGAAFLWTLEQGLGAGFTPEVKSAWVEVYGVVASVMKEAQATSDVGGPISPRQRRLVQGSWELVVPISEQAAAIFYEKLFELDPALKPLFKSNIAEQGKKLMQMLAIAVKGLDRLEDIVPAVEQLGVRHVDYGVKDEDYETVAAALLFTLEKGLGETFTDEVKGAWIAVYTLLSNTMKVAAQKSVASEPVKIGLAKSPALSSSTSDPGAGAGMLVTGLFVAFTVIVGFL